MNPFQKNPFVNRESTTRIVGYNKQYDEKKKIENIKENMTKLKFARPITIVEPKQEKKTLSFNEKIDLLKNINKYK